MKSILLPLAICAGLSGCAAYVDPYGASVSGSIGTGYGYPAQGVYTQPGYGYSQPYPAQGVYVQPGYGYGAPQGRGRRDRDHDGVPNRYDRDRDGDGVRNSQDARPNNPRRY